MHIGSVLSDSFSVLDYTECVNFGSSALKVHEAKIVQNARKA